jgi:hypothetical protein
MPTQVGIYDLPSSRKRNRDAGMRRPHDVHNARESIIRAFGITPPRPAAHAHAQQTSPGPSRPAMRKHTAAYRIGTASVDPRRVDAQPFRPRQFPDPCDASPPEFRAFSTASVADARASSTLRIAGAENRTAPPARPAVRLSSTQTIFRVRRTIHHAPSPERTPARSVRRISRAPSAPQRTKSEQPGAEHGQRRRFRYFGDRLCFV